MFLSTEQLAEELGVTVSTVRYWRTMGTGPRAVKAGRHVRYRRADVEAWLEASAQPQPAA